MTKYQDYDHDVEVCPYCNGKGFTVLRFVDYDVVEDSECIIQEQIPCPLCGDKEKQDDKA